MSPWNRRLNHVWLVIFRLLGIVMLCSISSAKVIVRKEKFTIEEKILAVTPPTSSKLAILYSPLSYHQEVVSSFACILHELGCQVHVALHNIIDQSNNSLLHDSIELYGSCVHSWVDLHTSNKKSLFALIPRASLILFVTYPLQKTHKKVRDNLAFEMLTEFNSTKDGKVVLIVHDSDETRVQESAISAVFPLARTLFMYLSNHTEAYARQYIMHGFSSLRLVHLYPVIPWWHLFASSRDAKNKSITSLTAGTFSVQGNFGGFHSFRRNTTSVIRCIEAIDNRAKRSIDFIGRGTLPVGDFDAGVVVRHLANTSGNQFYRAIADTKFLVSAAGTDRYLLNVATSSLPAAVMSHVPIVTSAALLRLYPCLRDGEVYKRITKAVECDSIRAAAALSTQEYAALVQETIHCAAQWWNHSLALMEAILRSDSTSPFKSLPVL